MQRSATGLRRGPGRSPAPRARRGGFTLIEILLALGILLIGLTGVLGLLTFGAAMSSAAVLRRDAAAASEAVFADLEERLFPIVVEDGVEFVGEPLEITRRPVPGYDGLSYSARAELLRDPAASSAAPEEYKVDVEMVWTSGGRQRSKTFTTLFVREVPFGERLRREFVERGQPAAEPSPSSATGPAPGSAPGSATGSAPASSSGNTTEK
ncbi:MAG: prepilin-type N-terminal cleavage/methylation domain-containing protein [Planctomycetes bacterium]|nr:prepilin-type N-terminal cleavage/methylation domain-containing protein [Planctomycetota bacterium]